MNIEKKRYTNIASISRFTIYLLIQSQIQICEILAVGIKAWRAMLPGLTNFLFSFSTIYLHLTTSK